mmetsp:Transcript_149924/g.417738  ORF Transcript_149924/g.417738 Transcript_149924/m.417738 type:complete len:319 (+) Transcript_149924:416-1372(+)
MAAWVPLALVLALHQGHGASVIVYAPRGKADVATAVVRSVSGVMAANSVPAVRLQLARVAPAASDQRAGVQGWSTHAGHLHGNLEDAADARCAGEDLRHRGPHLLRVAQRVLHKAGADARWRAHSGHEGFDLLHVLHYNVRGLDTMANLRGVHLLDPRIHVIPERRLPVQGPEVTTAQLHGHGHAAVRPEVRPHLLLCPWLEARAASFRAGYGIVCAAAGLGRCGAVHCPAEGRVSLKREGLGKRQVQVLRHHGLYGTHGGLGHRLDGAHCLVRDGNLAVPGHAPECVHYLHGSAFEGRDDVRCEVHPVDVDFLRQAK